MTDPIGNVAQIVPYDVLGEIFQHCLPMDPLSYRQPDVTQGPLLLCQVSSQWRLVALNTPTLWQHLYHESLVVKDENRNQSIHSIDINFLRWWRTNLRSFPPSLRLSLDMSRTSDFDGDKVRINEEEDRKFIIDFLSSAEYLDLDHFWSKILQKLFGDRPLDCPNMGTLLMRQGHRRTKRLIPVLPPIEIPTQDYDTQALIPIQPMQTLRRLFIEEISLTVPNLNNVLNWSQITHIFLQNVYFVQSVWFNLIHECTSLVAGTFVISITTDTNTFIPPVAVTLPYLRQLDITTLGIAIEQPIFLNLQLPSLMCLRLDIFPPVSVADLHGILTSTPALEELHLAPSNPFDPVSGQFKIPGPGDVLTPLWTIVPDLKFIHLGGYEPGAAGQFRRSELIRIALISPWLDIGRAGNRITCLEFGHSGTREFREDLERFIADLRPQVSPGVEIVLREENAPFLWRSRQSDGNSLVGCFQDMRFRLTL